MRVILLFRSNTPESSPLRANNDNSWTHWKRLNGSLGLWVSRSLSITVRECQTYCQMCFFWLFWRGSGTVEILGAFSYFMWWLLSVRFITCILKYNEPGLSLDITCSFYFHMICFWYYFKYNRLLCLSSVHALFEGELRSCDRKSQRRRLCTHKSIGTATLVNVL